jgi:hypothetical protein
LAVDGALDFRLNFRWEGCANGQTTNVVLQKHLDQSVDMSDSQRHSGQRHDAACRLNKQSICWVLKAQWMVMMNLGSAPFDHAPSDVFLLGNSLQPIFGKSTLDKRSIEDADSFAAAWWPVYLDRVA